MKYSILARDPETGNVVRRYTREGGSSALAMVEIIQDQGLVAEIEEKGLPRGRRTRVNPGELLILSGFAPNPKGETLADDHDLYEISDAFRDFHEGADPEGILQLPDDAVPAGTPKHLFCLGELVSVVYEVPKHSGKAPGPPFRHMLGEVGHSRRVVKANRPLLCATADGKYLVIVHRHSPGSKNTYRVRPEGIVG